ncbi:hypothetical protein BASA81_002527 [Batrachochytrium salamandrivorans]|nr:hypothetical protein BASA81_002527 [Batrachochytrium salamandrivorans]
MKRRDSLLLQDQASLGSGDDERSVLQRFRHDKLFTPVSALAPPPREWKTPSWIGEPPSTADGDVGPASFWEHTRLSPIPHPRTPPRRQQPSVEAEFQLARELEQQVETSRVEFSRQSLTGKQLSLLQSQVKDKADELQHAKQIEVGLRSSNFEYEERIAKLEASMAVLEARLEASMRREMALQGIAMFTPPALPVAVQIPEPEHPDVKLLEEEVQHLHLTLQEMEEGRTQAEQSRVGIEKQFTELETRAEYLQQGKRTLQLKLNKLTGEYQALQVQNQTLEREREYNKFAMQEMASHQTRHQERVSTSQNDHNNRKTLAALRDCFPDLEMLVGLVENQLASGKPRSMQDVQHWLRGKEEVPSDAMLATATATLAARAKSARLRAVERLAVEAHVQQQQLPPPNDKCGVQ